VHKPQSSCPAREGLLFLRFARQTLPNNFNRFDGEGEKQPVRQAVPGNLRCGTQNTIDAEGENAEKLLKMMDACDNNDDVQDVFANFEMDDENMLRQGFIREGMGRRLGI
jgi:hypothetical protein